MTRRWSAVVVEADGGSRGNPGPAAYGALLRDPATGEVIAHDGATIGRATNNVAEYRGLIAGLELAREFAPDAAVEVRMDSKLVVEQMAGRWRIKHPDMRPLALRAGELAPSDVRYTWVPRAENAAADRLANQALDGEREGVELLLGEVRAEGGREVQGELDLAEQDARPQPAAAAPTAPAAPALAPATTLVLVRHGVTEHTRDKRFSGGLAAANPGLVAEGRAQVRATAEWLRPLGEQVAAVVASPVRRAHESAEILAAVLGVPLRTEPGLAEMEFGAWDGLTFAEARERDRSGLDDWLGSLDARAGGTGESFREVEARVRAGLERVLEEYAGRTVVVVSHVTPIKVLVAQALGAPLDAVFRMELAPASVSVVAHYPPAPGEQPTADGAGRASLRLFNARPGDGPLG